MTRGRPRLFSVTPGDRYGHRVVIREDGRRGPHRMVLTRCDCGYISRVALVAMRNNRSLKCVGCAGTSSQCSLYIGQRLGNRTVIADAGISDRHHRVVLLCDCGNKSTVSQSNARRTYQCVSCASRIKSKMKRRVDRDEVRRLLSTGMMQKDIATLMGCRPNLISEIKLGKKK